MRAAAYPKYFAKQAFATREFLVLCVWISIFNLRSHDQDLFCRMVQNSQHVFEARLDNVRCMSSVLKSIAFKDYATVFISSNGLKFTVEESKCAQVNAFLQSDLFQTYDFTSDTLVFRINLNVLMECLNIFGGAPGQSFTSLKMYYPADGEPLGLVLEEGGVVTECQIKTMEADEILDFNFTSIGVQNKIIMKSECLRDAFSDLDISSQVIEMLMSPDSPWFRLSTFGHAGKTTNEYPKDSDMVESFECTKTQVNKYKLTLLKPSIKALLQSTKISIRMDNRGFLSLQYMIKTEDGNTCFVEYLCAPDEDNED